GGGIRAVLRHYLLDGGVANLFSGRRGGARGPAAAPGPAPARLLAPADVHRMRFTPAPLEQRGYHVEEVDAFLDLVAATLAHDGPGSLTVDDVRAVRFTVARLGVRGYQRDEVDAFLDLVVTALQQPVGLR
ncbi:DivIVA domain-containing protein, partial [Nocardia cyriacigeorgica]|uniref:DivIVA domain-containing protein n=1 Tax=Nocardia cyriacigeorgica TaxID=135487 RepID=UPI0024566250